MSTKRCPAIPNSPTGRRHAIALLLIALLATLPITSCSFKAPRTYHPPTARELAETHSPEELRQDLDFLVSTLRDTHANLYHDVSPHDFEAHVNHVSESLDRPMTREQFFWQIAPLLATVRDGHTRVEYPAERFAAHVANGGTIFPIDTRIRAETLLVNQSHGAGEAIPPGSIITRIQNSEVSPVLHELLSAQSAERSEFAAELATLDLRATLFERFGSPETWSITWQQPDGETHTTNFRGLTREELYTSRASRGATKPRNQDYSFRLMEHERIGVIDFRSMENPDAFADFLDRTFTAIEASDLRALIIDLRENSGGDSTLGDRLLARITTKPYRFISRMDVRSSRQYRAYLKAHAPALIRWLPIQNTDPYARALWGVPVGDTASFQIPEEPPPNARYRYPGPVYFLIGRRTYSSASMLATAVKDCQLATLVGEETGGLASHYGELYGFTLPRTHLFASSAVKHFTRPSGIDDGRGVIPDYIATTLPGTEDDEEMNLVLRLLEQP